MKKQNQPNNQGQQKQLKEGNRTQSKPKNQQKNYNYHKQVYYHSKCDYYIPLFWIYKILAETQQNQLDIKLIGCQCQILRAQFLQVIKDKCILCGQDYKFEKISLKNDAIICFLCIRSHEKFKNQQNQENPLRKFKFKKQALQYVESLLSKCMSCDMLFKKSQKYTNQQNQKNIIICQKCHQYNLKSISEKINCIKYIKFNNSDKNDKNEPKHTRNEAKRNQIQINNNQNEAKQIKVQEKRNIVIANNSKAELQNDQRSNSKDIINVRRQVKIQKDQIKIKNKQEKQEKLNQPLETTAANLSNLSFEQNSLISENIETFRRKIKLLEVKADQNSSIIAYQNKKLVQQQKQQKQQLSLISKNEESMRVMENKMNKKMQLLIKQYQKIEMIHSNAIQQNNRLSNANKQLMNESQELRNASKKLIDANKELTNESKQQIQAHQELMNAHKELIDANREVMNANKELMNENRDLKEKYAERDAQIHKLSNSFNQFKDETQKELLKIASQQKIISSIINPQNPQKQMLQYYLCVPDSFSESQFKQPSKQQQIKNINQNSQPAEDNERNTNAFSIGSSYYEWAKKMQNINPKVKLVRLIRAWNDKTSWGGSQYGQMQDVRMEEKEVRREEKEVRREEKEVRMEEKEIRIERKDEENAYKKKNGNIQVSQRSNTQLFKKNPFLKL